MTYTQSLQKEGARDVERRLVAEFPPWFKSHVHD
jgi:hypothetical protein